ncbi:hypothetical protein [Nocardiopsis nanhaiensis]
MAENLTNAETTRRRYLAYIRQHPGGVTDTDITIDLGLHPRSNLPYHLNELAKRGLVWRDRRGRGGRWFPVEHGQAAPPTPVGPIQARRRAEVVRLAQEQGYATIAGVQRALGYQGHTTASRLLRDLEREGFLVPCDVPPEVPLQDRGYLAWKLAEHPPAAAARLHGFVEHRTRAEQAMFVALEAMTDPDAHLDLDDVFTTVVTALDGPLRAHIAAGLEEWARQEEASGADSAKVHTLRQVSAWITRTVTTLNASS